MRADVIKLRDEVCTGQCPCAALEAITVLLLLTQQQSRRSGLRGEESLAVLAWKGCRAGKPCMLLVSSRAT
jgi:hypothetical protein